MESNSSVTRRIAPAHRTFASDANPLEKPSPDATVALLNAGGNDLPWSSTDCQAYSLSTGPASSGLVGFGIPGAGTVQALTPMAGSLNREPSTIDTQISNKPRKPRRPKPRIQLAPDQPPTTQGKPRARVYVACVQCRTRKIRCDGAKPACHNCNRRANSECEYDPLPKRRGPDKTPGARQRIVRDLPDQLDGPAQPSKRRRTQEIGDKNDAEDAFSDSAVPHIQQGSDKDSAASKWHDATYCPMFLASSVGSPTGKFCIPQNLYHNPIDYSNAGNYYLVEVADETQRSDAIAIDVGPSTSFTRKVWWDSLLCLYLPPAAARHEHLTPTQRDMASRSIMSDLRFVFRQSNYWFSFFHVPTFFGNFCDPLRRENMQPCLVLALLATSVFWQSSEIELGERGRMRALRLRDEAQAALEASISSRWIDETVAQAAWILAMFEICSHPTQSAARAMSALALLDSLIRSLSLTLLDADDTDTTTFSLHSVPTVPQKAALAHNAYQASSDYSGITDGYIGCRCKALTLASNWALTNEHTPLWSPSPAWNATWTVGEMRKESCRRLCWSSLSLAAGHVSYMSANRVKPPDLFISNPANYALLFSGEFIARSPISSPQSSKDTVWALYDRCHLLWHGCVRMRNDTTVPDGEKSQFAIRAWLEADALEAALNQHTCNLERAFLFISREYIFNIRMCISCEYQRWIPLATANVNGLFHRKKAEEWLTHQATVARRLMDGLHTITGISNNVLARRPFFVPWFIAQMNRSLCLWEYDQTLVTALDVCKALITVVDYLSSIWPSPALWVRYEKLRRKVENACRISGVGSPQPLNWAPLVPNSTNGLA